MKRESQKRDEERVISEANPKGLATLLGIMLSVLAIGVWGELNGAGLKSGIYYAALGNLVYVIFFGGILYACWEFGYTLFNRKRYIIYDDGYISILKQARFAISEIHNIEIKRGMIFNRLEIYRKDGAVIKVISYMLLRDVEDVKTSIMQIMKQA